MSHQNVSDLLTFLAVAREKSFTKAAAKLGVSQSALSHSIRGLEDRLGVRLLTRTTRSVSPTEAGTRLLQTVGPRFEEIDAELTALNEFKEKPTGTIRIVCDEHALDTIIWPKLTKFLQEYPEIKFEVAIDYGKIDIVRQRYDAGVNLHEFVAKDMIAVPVAPEMRMAVVGSPSYFSKHGKPKVPRDLLKHNCINLRLPTHGGFCNWEFEKGHRMQRIRVDGQLVFNEMTQTLTAALAGLGLAYLPDELPELYVSKKRLIRVLDDWCPPFPGYHIFYPSRRQPSPAFSLFVDALRYRP